MDHQHEHNHDDHDHDHSHAPAEDPYYLDQLCLVGVSGAFGLICLALYFWQKPMLQLMLRRQFHIYVVGSGVVLVLFAVVRAGVLWIQVGKAAQEHPAATESCGDGCGHEHHADHHEHAHADHEHSWAPWRYVLLLVPIVLFLMGLPNEMMGTAPPPADVSSVNQDRAIALASSVALGPSWAQAGLLVGLVSEREAGVADPIDFLTLESLAYQENNRKDWRGKNVWVKGQFAPDPTNSCLFYLVRYRIQCCYADRVALNVPMLSQESILHVRPDNWVKVTGKVDFYNDAKGYHTLLRVNSSKNVEKTARETDWYLK